MDRPRAVETPAVLLHFSEDPDLGTFDPHVPPTNPGQEPAVWAVDPAHAPLYWFPRDCPASPCGPAPWEQQDRMREAFCTSATRLHATPLSWLGAIRGCRLYAYEFPSTAFVPWPEAEGQWVAHERVVATTVRSVGDLLSATWTPAWSCGSCRTSLPCAAAVPTSELPFSIVRYRVNGRDPR